MYFASDLYSPQTRYVHSESYFNPKEKINITENRLGCNTFNPNHHGAMVGSNNAGTRTGTHTAFSSIRKNRLKLLRNPHFRIGLGMDGGSNKHSGGSADSLNDSNGNLPMANGQQEQLYVKIGEMNPATSDYDYSGMRWTHQQQSEQQYQQRQMHHDQQQPSPSCQSNQCMQQQQQQLSNSSGQSSQSIYENHHRQNSSDKDMIYAPSSGNRSIISYMSSNKRFDEV